MEIVSVVMCILGAILCIIGGVGIRDAFSGDERALGVIVIAFGILAIIGSYYLYPESDLEKNKRLKHEIYLEKQGVSKLKKENKILEDSLNKLRWKQD
jgi:hypothetical protein